MSKHGPCTLDVHRGDPTPAIAWWRVQDSAIVRLCKNCLDCWFDNADDDPGLEPTAWGWLIPPKPALADVAAWASDPRNHTAVAEVLRREARISPNWLRDFLDREDRARRRDSRLILR